MWTDKEMPADITKRAQALCAEGDVLSERDPTTAILRFSEAFKLLPDPKHRWLTATWILTAIGDTAFMAGDLHVASEAFREIGRCEGWHSNPFVRLRRGQVAFENGDLKQASNELASAFMLDGYRIFEREDQKYAEFVLSQMRPPVPPVDHPLARFHLQAPEGEPGPSGAAKRWWKFW